VTRYRLTIEGAVITTRGNPTIIHKRWQSVTGQILRPRGVFY